MQGVDRRILVVLPVLVLVVGFWLLVIGPKRSESAALGDQAETLRESIAVADSEVAVAEQARQSFPENYSDLVSLGTAVPEDDDQATFVQNLSELARRESVSFRSFELTPGDGAAPVAPAPATTPTAPPAEGATTTTTAAAPTEAAAAALPLGATVGPAGLPVMPYTLTYFGGFFDMADLLASLDARVEVTDSKGGPKVDGRLITIDSFAMSADPIRGFPRVRTDLSITTYLVPAEQGIAAGATPAGPAPVGSTTVADPIVVPPAGTTAAVAP